MYKVVENRVFLDPEKLSKSPYPIESSDLQLYLESIGVKTKSKVAELKYDESGDVDIQETLYLCTIGIPFIYFRHDVIYLDKDMIFHKVSDVEYMVNNGLTEDIPCRPGKMVLKPKDIFEDENRINIKYNQLQTIKDMVSSGDCVSEKYIQRELYTLLRTVKQVSLRSLLEYLKHTGDYEIILFENKHIDTHDLDIQINLSDITTVTYKNINESNAWYYISTRDVRDIVNLMKERIKKSFEYSQELNCTLKNTTQYQSLLKLDLHIMSDTLTNDSRVIELSLPGNRSFTASKIVVSKENKEKAQSILDEIKDLEIEKISSAELIPSDTTPIFYQGLAYVDNANGIVKYVDNGAFKEESTLEYARRTRCSGSALVLDSNNTVKRKRLPLNDYDLWDRVKNVSVVAVCKPNSNIFYSKKIVSYIKVGMGKDEYIEAVAQAKYDSTSKRNSMSSGNVNYSTMSNDRRVYFLGLKNLEKEEAYEYDMLVSEFFNPCFYPARDSGGSRIDFIEITFDILTFLGDKRKQLEVVKRQRKNMDATVCRLLHHSKKFKKLGLKISDLDNKVELTNDNRVIYKFYVKDIPADNLDDF